MSFDQITEIGTRQYNQLNKKQKKIVDFVINKLDNNTNNNISNYFYIDGLSGRSKTFVYTTIYYLAKIKQKHIYIHTHTLWLLQRLQQDYFLKGKQFIKHLVCQFRYLLILYLLFKCNQRKLSVYKK